MYMGFGIFKNEVSGWNLVKDIKLSKCAWVWYKREKKQNLEC